MARGVGAVGIALPAVKAGDAVIVLASPSLRENYAGQVADVEHVLEAGEIGVRIGGKPVPLSWEEGDRWRRAADGVTASTSWLHSSGPLSSKAWESYPLTRPEMPAIRAMMDAEAEVQVNIASRDGASATVEALYAALSAGVTSDAALEPFYRRFRAKPLPEAKQRIAIRIAQLYISVQRENEIEFTCNSDYIHWADYEGELGDDCLRPLAMLLDGYEALGCELDVEEW